MSSNLGLVVLVLVTLITCSPTLAGKPVKIRPVPVDTDTNPNPRRPDPGSGGSTGSGISPSGSPTTDGISSDWFDYIIPIFLICLGGIPILVLIGWKILYYCLKWGIKIQSARNKRGVEPEPTVPFEKRILRPH